MWVCGCGYGCVCSMRLCDLPGREVQTIHAFHAPTDFMSDTIFARDFTGTRGGAAADQGGVGGGVVRRSKRAPADHDVVALEDPDDALDARHFQQVFSKS